MTLSLYSIATADPPIRSAPPSASDSLPPEHLPSESPEMIPTANGSAKLETRSVFRGLRLARPEDEGRLLDICLEAYRENGFGGLDEDNVRAIIASACRGDTYVMALIDGPHCIEAVVGLQPARSWFGDDASWFWTDTLAYVRPEFRKSRHAVKLMKFLQWFSQQTGQCILFNVMPREGFERKVAFFARFGKIAGVTIKIGDFASK